MQDILYISNYISGNILLNLFKNKSPRLLWLSCWFIEQVLKKKNQCPRKCPLFSAMLLDFFSLQAGVLFFSDEKWNQQLKLYLF